MREFYGLTYPQTAQKVLGMFLTDYDPDFLKTATEQTYSTGNFGGKAGFAAHVAGNTYALELWHGPTCAFKDYALQLMPRLLVEAKKNLGETGVTKILVATSGDTGKAALAGYAGLPGIRIAVFYPNAGTSEVQRLQMSTQEGDNVAVYAVNGNFDDAQTGVKRVFAGRGPRAGAGCQKRKAFQRKLHQLGPPCTADRLLFLQLCAACGAGDIAPGAPVSFCVPTGNFGDILAGYYAKRMGLPVEKLICASNKNNVLTDFLTTGVYDARRTFYKTSSPSMDILVSSNLERLLYHVTQDAAAVAGWMRELAEHGHYTVPAEVLSAIRETFACGCADDAQVREEIRARYEADGYLCDTHTAVAFRVARQQAAGETPCVVLSTASPYKFPCDVLGALGADVPEDEFEAMRLLQEKTGVPAPASLAGPAGKARTLHAGGGKGRHPGWRQLAL